MLEKLGINGIEFNSKTQAQKYVKELLTKYTNNDILSQEDFEFMIAYFKHFHYEWIRKSGAGVEYIFIKKSVWDNNEFWIQRVDGSTTDISYILKRIEKPDYKYMLELALSQAVSNDILAFKNELFKGQEQITLEETNEEVTENDVELTYIDNSFRTITTEFMASKELKATAELFVANDDLSSLPELIDADLVAAFVAYHNEVAKLKAVSVKANRALLNKK